MVLHWSLKGDGETLQQRHYRRYSHHRRRKPLFELPLHQPQLLKPGCEYFLHCEVRLKQPYAWAEADHVVAHQQFGALADAIEYHTADHN